MSPAFSFSILNPLFLSATPSVVLPTVLRPLFSVLCSLKGSSNDRFTFLF
jgi:hypothetical protein